MRVSKKYWESLKPAEQKFIQYCGHHLGVQCAKVILDRFLKFRLYNPGARLVGTKILFDNTIYEYSFDRKEIIKTSIPADVYCATRSIYL